ncbi:piggyBac transposable element-derived protein 4-like [Stegodyphus dumicola]|uniref:piggyBac transposable element-derived protein 4-like n=1 Tax=Stegodyphus dumicola TaxID=202533 RepID=UPI0015B3742E|nr:piggyBac transposable element-derived protein 4-like [Stegodyphus dumicola]
MYRRKKGLTQEEIEKLLQDLENEAFGDSDSECEIDNDEGKEVSSFMEFQSVSEDVADKGKNINEFHLEDIDINWVDPDISMKTDTYSFKGTNALKGNAAECSNEIDFFECVFQMHLLDFITLETNNYIEQFFELTESVSKKAHSVKWKNVSASELRKFLALTLLMGHIDKDSLKDYWSTDEMIETPFFGKAIARDRYLNILRFLHFSDNKLAPNKEDPEYDRMWKIRNVFEILNYRFKEIYDPTEELAVDEVIVAFKGRVVFRQYIPKKRKRFGIKVYKLADKNGYTFNMRVYLGKDKVLGDGEKCSAHRTVTGLVECVKGKGHKLFMDNFFSSSQLFLELHRKYKINSCGTVRSNRKYNPKILASPRMKKGECRELYSQGMEG